MNRRNFLKSVFGAAGALAVAPFVSGIDIDTGKSRRMWIQVIATDCMTTHLCIGAGDTLKEVTWMGKTWNMPYDSGKAYAVDAVDEMLGVNVDKKYDFWCTGWYGESMRNDRFMAFYDSGTGIPTDHDDPRLLNGVHSATDLNGRLIYQWWYDDVEHMLDDQLGWTDSIDRSLWIGGHSSRRLSYHLM